MKSSKIYKVFAVAALLILSTAVSSMAALNVSIVDKIKAELTDANRGRLVAVPSESGTYTFEWYSSIDGASWNKIERKKTITVFGHDYYNMSETGDWIDPSVDRLASGVTEDSKRLVYKVKIATKDGSPVGTEIMSTPYRIPYYCALMNGDFENLLIPGNLYPYPWSGNSSASNPGGKYWVSSDLTDAQIKANATPVYGSYFVYERHEEELIWKTTDKFGCLEIINASPDKSVNPSTSASYNKGTYQNFVLNNLLSGIKTGGANGATLNGEQMAELNSESVATLYQDVLTIPGTELKWDIWHRARAVTGAEHIDKMRVLIMDSYLAEILLSMYPEDPQQAVVYIVNHPDEFPGAFVSEELTADVYKWSEHNGEYNVPENQNLTRMFFVSESGSPGMGNFLDGVTFSVTKPLPQYDEAVINIQKTISGVLTDAQASTLKSNLEFSVTVSETTETVKGINMLWQIDSSGDWIGTWSKRYEIEADETKPYTVTENKSSAEIPQLVLEYSDSGNTTGSLEGGNTYDIQFTNNYKKSCPWCSLQDMINAAPDNTPTSIQLTQNITAQLEEHLHTTGERPADIRLLVPENKQITIDLNGYTIDRNLTGKDAMVDGNVFTVAEGASLTIMDSSADADNPYGKGIITGGNNSSEGGAIYVYNGGTFVLENGNITGNRTIDIGGAIFNGGELQMKNGSISDNTTDCCGGGISNKGILTVTGGIITNNKALGKEFGGGGIYNDDGCTATVSNCTISLNQGDLGGAIQNMGMGTVTMTNTQITDNIARLSGNGVFQMGVLNLGSGNTFGKDQIVYLPGDAGTRSKYVITKAGDLSSVVPVQLANETIGRDILVSKADASSSADGKVTVDDLSKLNVVLSNKELIVIYNKDGGDADITPKDVIELTGAAYIIIRRKGLNAGENAIYSVYWKESADASYVRKFTVSMNNENNTPKDKTYAERTIKGVAPGIYKVVEESWTWAYKPDEEPTVVPSTGAATGDNWASSPVDYSQSVIFTFSGAAKGEEDKLPKHGEGSEVNDFSKYGTMNVTVEVTPWADGQRTDIDFETE